MRSPRHSQRTGLRVGLVGLGFGAEFVPIYLNHPDVESLTICDPDATVVAAVGNRYDVSSRSDDFEALLDMPDLDAIHLVTPIPLHAQHTLAVLRSGRHCACTVPMATSIADLEEIVTVQRASGLVYMMMETAVYTREFLYVRERLRGGAMGRIQFLRGAHYQDMERWPGYWMGLPPMHDATHAIAPLLALSGSRATRVHCLGSGRMRPQLQARYGNPYPIETAIFGLSTGDAALEVTRSLFDTARAYSERFDVLAERESFEWAQIDSGDQREGHVLFAMGAATDTRGRPVQMTRVEAPDRGASFPKPSGASRGWASTTRRGLTVPSSRAAATAARIRISCTNSSAASWRGDPHRSMRSRPRTGRQPALPPMTPRCAAAMRWTFRALPGPRSAPG